MPIRPLAALLGLSILSTTLIAAARPQEPSSPAPAPDQQPAPSLTLHAESHIVLADITVTDRHGNTVHDLKPEDFEVFDDNQQQRIASFEEHNLTTEGTYTAPVTRGTATNAFEHLPPVLNVLLIDTTNLELPDQMYLRIQLTKFIKSLSGSQPLAVFDRHGDLAVLLQPFTSDRALLHSAVDRAVPRVPLSGREYRTDSDTLRQISVYLAQIPGRKNVLWFSGGSTAYLLYGLSSLAAAGARTGPAASSAAGAAAASASAPATPITAGMAGDNPDELRDVYDELEAARIALYPIDARGLTTEGNVALPPQQLQMEENAEATGGQAFFNNNGLDAIASHVLATDSSSYTLTWSPENFHYNGKWHTIRIVARNRDYHLSYRRGYFADRSHHIDTASHKIKTLLAGEGNAVTAPDLRSSPLLFEATVHPASTATAESQNFVHLRKEAPAHHGDVAFAVDYSLSTTGLTAAIIDGSPRATVVFAILAIDSDGNRVGQVADRVRFALMPGAPPRKLQVEQNIDLPKGGSFLALAVWDPASGHIGTLQIPVSVGEKTKR